MRTKKFTRVITVHLLDEDYEMLCDLAVKRDKAAAIVMCTKWMDNRRCKSSEAPDSRCHKCMKNHGRADAKCIDCECRNGSLFCHFKPLDKQ